jgi:predicted nucleotidyltransferase
MIKEKGGDFMSASIEKLLQQYTDEIKNIYGSKLNSVILYGSYARGDYHENSDIDIMILLNIDDLESKRFSKKLSYYTYDFNMDHNLDIMPITKSKDDFFIGLKLILFIKTLIMKE